MAQPRSDKTRSLNNETPDRVDSNEKADDIATVTQPGGAETAPIARSEAGRTPDGGSATRVNQKNLGIYLNDHLAGAVAGVELAKRAARNNQGSEWGAFLERLSDEIEADRTELVKLMDALGVKQDVLKDAAAWLGEKVGRLKLNGQLVGYSELSRLVELDGLALGITGKLALWRVLKAADIAQVRTSGVDLDALEERARKQRDELEDYRLRAGVAALRA